MRQGNQLRITRGRLCGMAAAVVTALALVLPTGAGATFPGSNGLIAFEDGSDAGIYTINSRGQHRTLINAGGWQPSWSPNGERIAFIRVVEGPGYALRTMKADGSAVHTIFVSKTPIWEPAWSPSATRLVYRRGGARNTSDGDLWMINTRGQNNHLLVKNGGNPDWSAPTASTPQGRIVFQRSIGSCAATELYAINPDGSGEHALPFSCEVSFEPSWSPDAARLAFASYPGALSDIYTGNYTSGRRSRVTDLPGYDGYPAWSPNGSAIVFTGDLGKGGLYLVKPSNPFVETAIQNTKAVSASRADWQPR